jgi:hypothetical protein
VQLKDKLILDDLLTSTAGGVIRMKNPNAIVPMTVQSNAGQSFPMLEYLDGIQAKRTGVSDSQQGLDPDLLTECNCNGCICYVISIYRQTRINCSYLC